MTSKVDKYRVGRAHDRRFKLNDDDREQIKRRHDGGESYRKLSRDYRVSHKTIRFIVNPDLYELDKRRHKEEKSWKKYYDGERAKHYRQNHKKYKLYLMKQENNKVDK